MRDYVCFFTKYDLSIGHYLEMAEKRIQEVSKGNMPVNLEGIIELWHIQPKFEAWLSASIPIGFVTGAFVSAYFGLADRFNVRYIFALSATAGALFNGVIIFVDEAAIGIVLRILTGASLAGVYPVAVKMLSQWFPKKRGVAIGILIASLTICDIYFTLFFVGILWYRFV